MQTVITYRFEEEDFAHTYYLEDYYCTNPFCDCNHVTLSFRDQEDEYNRISFLLNFNGSQSALPNQPKLTPVQSEIIKGFVKELPKEMMNLYKQRYTEAKSHGEKNPMTYLIFESGRYVNFLEFFPKAKDPLEFEFNNVKYFVEDAYDMDPRNDNKDLDLTFFKFDLGDAEKQKPEFTYRYYFSEKKREEADSTLPEDQSALILAMNTTLPNLLNLFKDRYKRIKTLGDELLKKSPRKTFMEANIHRNELCPCGSGKKFKRCCGAENKLN